MLVLILGQRETGALLDMNCLQNFSHEVYDNCYGIHFCLVSAHVIRDYTVRSLCILSPGIYGQACPNLVSYMATYDDVVHVLQVLVWSD